MANSFGVYIMTYPGDFHLAKALINSLEYFNPDISITILPGPGFDRTNHPFKAYNIYHPDEQRWGSFEYMDIKFSLFEGPYTHFLYLDADVICLQKITGLFDRMITDDQNGKTAFYVNLPHKYYGEDATSKWGDDRHIKIENGQIGTLKNIGKFDSEYLDDIYNHYPFNAGVWAASRDLFKHEELIEHKAKEAVFFQEVLHQRYHSTGLELFYTDQGKFNYLAWKQKVTLQPLYPDAHYIWGGKLFPYTLEHVLNGKSDIPFIHWAGCPRPSASIFNLPPLFYFYAKTWGFLGYEPTILSRVAGGSIWKFFSRDTSVASRLRFSYNDTKKLVRQYTKAFFRRLLPTK